MANNNRNRDTNIKEIVDYYTADKVYVDIDIQRKPGNWTSEDRACCLGSYNKGRVDAPLVFVHVQECLDKINKDLDPLSFEYYTDLAKRDYKWVIIDGQHKWKNVIQDFVAGKWAYPAGMTLMDKDGNELKWDVDKYFNQLPQRVQDAINDAEVPVRMYTDFKATEINEQFINLQKGVELNPQQKRRATRTKLTPWVRSLAENNKKLFKSLLNGRGGNTIAASADEEFIVKLLVSTVTKWDNALKLRANKNKENVEIKGQKYRIVGFNLSKKDLDIVYETGKDIDPRHSVNSPYNKQEFERFMKIFEDYVGVVCGISPIPEKRNKKGEVIKYEQPKMLKTSTAWMLWWAVEDYYNKNLTPPDSDELLSIVEGVIHQEKVKSLKAYTDAVSTADKTGEEPPTEFNYFFRQVDRPHECKRRNAAKETFLDAFAEEIFKRNNVAA